MLEGGKDWRSRKPESRGSRATKVAIGRTTDGKVSKLVNLKTVCSTGSIEVVDTTLNLVNGKILRVAD